MIQGLIGSATLGRADNAVAKVEAVPAPAAIHLDRDDPIIAAVWEGFADLVAEALAQNFSLESRPLCGCGLSRFAVARALRALEHAGLIRKPYNGPDDALSSSSSNCRATARQLTDKRSMSREDGKILR